MPERSGIRDELLEGLAVQRAFGPPLRISGRRICCIPDHGAQTKCLAPTSLQVLIVRSETAKGSHKVFDLARRRALAEFEVALNA